MPEHRLTLGEDARDLNRTVWEVMAEAGLDLPAHCGGRGRCGRCRVTLAAGDLTPPTGLEVELLGGSSLAQGVRLACQARVSGRAEIVWDSLPAAAVKSFGACLRKLPLAPAVKRGQAALKPPKDDERLGDWERLNHALKLRARPDPWACAGLTGAARTQGKLEVIISADRLLGLAAPGKLLGAVFDLGTTTIAGGLFDVEDGSLAAAASALNAQRIYGADVISRLAFAQGGAVNLAALRDRCQGQIRSLLRGLLTEAGAKPENVVDLVLVGNTAMEHFFYGFAIDGLASLPFAPLHQTGMILPAAAIGLPAHPGARLYSAPNLAGFVGGDTVAGIVATGLGKQPGPSLLMDLGTNGEMVLSCEGNMWACSTAAGPAFEGAGLSCGMPAAAGAVERVWLDGELKTETIGGAEPAGLCGSGLVDALAVLRQTGALEPSGRLRAGGDLPPALRSRHREGPDGLGIMLAAGSFGEVLLTQGDIRQAQLAKGAIAAGVRVLCAEAGIKTKDLRRVFLAGNFGQRIETANALRIGLLPGVEPARVQAVGNAAGEGARLLLLNRACREEAEALVEKVKVVELAARPGFQDIFADEMAFPE